MSERDRRLMERGAKEERLWLLAECEPHKGILGCDWRGTRAETLIECTNGMCPSCGVELAECNALRERQKGLD